MNNSICPIQHHVLLNDLTFKQFGSSRYQPKIPFRNTTPQFGPVLGRLIIDLRLTLALDQILRIHQVGRRNTNCVLIPAR